MNETFNCNQNWQSKKIVLSKKHQDMVFDSKINNLDFIERDGKKVLLTDNRWMTEFVSCSYLGLDQHPSLNKASKSAIDQYGIQFSAARTRIKADLFTELDKMLSEIMHGASIVTFNCVTSCHLSVFSLLASGDLPGFKFTIKPEFIIDNTSHSSIQINRGLLEQFGKVHRVDFNDSEILEEKFKAIREKNHMPISLSDSVGSMGGVMPVKLIAELANKYNGFVYLDDAHGTSVFGQNGEGYVLSVLGSGFPSNIIVAGSLAKAFGAHGGFLAVASQETASFIKRYGNTYIFGGPPCIPGIAACIASAQLHLSDFINNAQEDLSKNLLFFDSCFDDAAFNLKCLNKGTYIPIRGVIIGDEQRAIRVAAALQKKGFSTTVAMYPTVKLGEAMIRCAISSLHNKEEIQGLIHTLSEIVNANL